MGFSRRDATGWYFALVIANITFVDIVVTVMPPASISVMRLFALDAKYLTFPSKA
jgi:hypothetical protein